MPGAPLHCIRQYISTIMYRILMNFIFRLVCVPGAPPYSHRQCMRMIANNEADVTMLEVIILQFRRLFKQNLIYYTTF